MQRHLPGHLLPENSRLLASLIEEAGPRSWGCPSASKPRGFTDHARSIALVCILLLALGLFMLIKDSEDRGPSFVCDLKGLNPVKDPVFSRAVTPLCWPPRTEEHQMPG